MVRMTEKNFVQRQAEPRGSEYALLAERLSELLYPMEG